MRRHRRPVGAGLPALMNRGQARSYTLAGETPALHP